MLYFGKIFGPDLLCLSILYQDVLAALSCRSSENMTSHHPGGFLSGCQSVTPTAELPTLADTESGGGMNLETICPNPQEPVLCSSFSSGRPPDSPIPSPMALPPVLATALCVSDLSTPTELSGGFQLTNHCSGFQCSASQPWLHLESAWSI